MPDINNAIALGVQPPPQQKPADIIAPIASLAQLQYLNANAERVKAETSQIGLNTQFNQGKINAIANYNNRIKGGETPEKALISSGLATYDPAGATATIGNIKGGLELGAIRSYKPGDPTSLASGGPEVVGKEVSNLSNLATADKTRVDTEKVKTDTAKQQQEITQEQRKQYGQVGNIMTAPGGTSPQGRALVAAMMRQSGVAENFIQAMQSAPDDKYVEMGQHFRVASIYPEKYMELSGEGERNKGVAKAQTAIEKVGPTDSIVMGPAAQQAFTGSPAGQPSLGNFSPPQAAPGAPALAAPATPAVAPAATPATPPQAPVRNVSAVATPSVGVNVPAAVTAAGNKYGISPEYMARTFQIESGGNPNAYNAQSKAAGPFQFVPSTGAKYLNGASPFDVGASADAAARLASDNKQALTKALGRAPTDAELYLAHQQGAEGAAKLLANPNARAGDLVGNSAIAANGGNPNAPAAAFTNLWSTKFNGGVGKTIPTAAVSPNVTPVAPAGNGASLPGAIAPLAAALTPAAPAQAPAPAAPLQPAPVPATQAESNRIATNLATLPPSVPLGQPAPASPVPGAPPPTGTAADNTRPLAPVVSGMGPAALAEQTHIGEAYGKVPEELDKAANAAKVTNTTLDEMATASDGWRMGKWATQEETARESLQAIAKTFGVETPGIDKKIESYQDFAKLSGNILRQASHETSSRVGVQEMQLISKSLPSPEMSEGGFKAVATQLKGLNDFAIAKQQAAADWKSSNKGSLGPNASGKDFQSSWNANASPAAFVLHRMQVENPAMLQNLVSTMSKTAEGQAALKAMRSQMQWANSQGLFGK